MQRYENGKIYKLVNDVDNEIYVGSTCLPLAKRIGHHRALSKIKVNRPIYEKLNQIGWENVHIILVESFPCENKMELLKRERHYVDLLKPKLNKINPMRTDEEVKQTKQKSDKKYYEAHKQKLLVKVAEYRNKNREHILKKAKVARATRENKDKRNEKEREKTICTVCNQELTFGSVYHHNRSKKHIEKLNVQPHIDE